MSETEFSPKELTDLGESAQDSARCPDIWWVLPTASTKPVRQRTEAWGGFSDVRRTVRDRVR